MTEHLSPSQARVLKLHRDLDGIIRAPGKDRHFISGWRTSHPFAERYAELIKDRSEKQDAQQYSFLSDSLELQNHIVAFHETFDRVSFAPIQVFPSVGSSPLITTLMHLLLARNISTIFYVPPIYYLFYYYARLFGFRLVPIDREPLGLAASRGSIVLPETESVLLLTDPIWIFGVPVPEHHIDRIHDWQKKTGSLVLVDGTFQYTRWRQPWGEYSSTLDPDQTIRLICPTKSLAVHGFRFAYLLIPHSLREDVRYACSNLTGATGIQELSSALGIMRIMASTTGNRELTRYISDTFARCCAAGLISDIRVPPEVSYYTMGRLNENALRGCITMTGDFFELSSQFASAVRLNLLYPSLDSLLSAVG